MALSKDNLVHGQPDRFVGSSKDPARAPNVGPIEFSDVHDELVAHPRFYDCHFKARDPVWLDKILSKEKATGMARAI